MAPGCLKGLLLMSFLGDLCLTVRVFCSFSGVLWLWRVGSKIWDFTYSSGFTSWVVLSVWLYTCCWNMGGIGGCIPCMAICMRTIYKLNELSSLWLTTLIISSLRSCGVQSARNGILSYEFPVTTFVISAVDLLIFSSMVLSVKLRLVTYWKIVFMSFIRAWSLNWDCAIKMRFCKFCEITYNDTVSLIASSILVWSFTNNFTYCTFSAPLA